MSEKIKGIDYSDRDRKEDFKQENGNYHCICCKCDNSFIGNKHRVICYLCANTILPETSDDVDRLAEEEFYFLIGDDYDEKNPHHRKFKLGFYRRLQQTKIKSL